MIKIGDVEINNSISKNAFRIIYIFSILSICLMLFGSFKGFISVRVLNQSTLTEATVIQNLYTPTATADEQQHYSVEFKYVVNSKEYIAQDDLGDKLIKYNVGEKIKIYYDNEYINKAQIYRIEYIPLVFAMFLLPVCTLVFIKSENRK